MWKSKFSEHQILETFKAGEAGGAVKDVFANTRSATDLPPLAGCLSWKQRIVA
jgi:hypothetical protein